MKMFHKAASGATLLVSATSLIALHAHAQAPDYLARGEADLNAGNLDQAQLDLSQALQTAQANGDVAALLRLTKDYKTYADAAIQKYMPPPNRQRGYYGNVAGVYYYALIAARDKACYDPQTPGSGTNVSGGQADLRSTIAFFNSLYGPGTPNPAPGPASELKDTLSALQNSAQLSLNDSTSGGGPACQSAPLAPAPAPAPVPIQTITSTPTPTNTSGTSGSTPAPTNTSGTTPAPTNTSGTAPAPTNTSAAALSVAPISR